MPWSVILLVKRRKSHGLFDWEKKLSVGCGLGCRDVDWDHPKIELKIEEWKVKTRKNNCKAARGRSATSKCVYRG